jgi:pimeloyl-ACP methyl ester carboxylesterase
MAEAAGGAAPVPAAESVASFIPSNPLRVLVLAHGYPWPDDSRSDEELIRYARATTERWAAFAEAHSAILVAPAFGGSDFAGYREMSGRELDPDEFVNSLVDESARTHIPGFSGIFSLHGHSAGAQFAARYLVTHPQRLEQVVLSAPSTYPFPDPAVPWPNGMVLAPRPAGWLAAASQVRVSVLVGSADTEPRPAVPGQHGSTRMERAAAWVESMQRHAEAHERAPGTRLIVAEGLDHDEVAMAIPAQEILARGWDASPSRM